jgi:hypothetical protein
MLHVIEQSIEEHGPGSNTVDYCNGYRVDAQCEGEVDGGGDEGRTQAQTRTRTDQASLADRD